MFCWLSGGGGRRVAGMCGRCGEYAAKYVCEACGKAVCEACFDPQRWVCTECLNNIVGRMGQPADPVAGAPPSRLLSLFFTGFLIVFVGMALMIGSRLFSDPESVSGGAVIFIGPMPSSSNPARSPSPSSSSPSS
jgi:hypothetical protein